MAKVDALTMHVEGKEYSYNINVGKTGVFTITLDKVVSESLGFKTHKLSDTNMKNLLLKVKDAYSEYQTSSTEESVWIRIEYASSGSFNCKSDGSNLHGKHQNYDAGKWADDPDSLCFDFEVLIRQLKSNSGQELWYDTLKGQGCVAHGEQNLNDPDTYYKNRYQHSLNRGKLIPYSPEAITTLKKAREGIRSISEILFNFIENEEDVIVQLLASGNLLPETTN